ncbi:hypothetical protein EON63_24840, partial [archaeon]
MKHIQTIPYMPYLHTSCTIRHTPCTIHHTRPFTLPPAHPFNPLLALRCVVAMKDEEQQLKFVRAMLKKCWGEGKVKPMCRTTIHITYTIYHIPYTIYHIPYTIHHIP